MAIRTSFLHLLPYFQVSSQFTDLFYRLGLLAASIQKVTKSEFTANFYSLIVLMTLTCSILVANSIQMCYQVRQTIKYLTSFICRQQMLMTQSTQLFSCVCSLWPKFGSIRVLICSFLHFTQLSSTHLSMH